MDIIKTGAFIKSQRKRLNYSQASFGSLLSVSSIIVSKWERGLFCPDIETIKKMSLLFGCTVPDIISGEILNSNSLYFTDSFNNEIPFNSPDSWNSDVEFTLDYSLSDAISPLLFGDNLEHTRACIATGLSAELLRNRKFIGKPGRYGCAHEWIPVGDAYFSFGTSNEYYSHGSPYTRHADGYKMRRRHERNAQYITNYSGKTVGIEQRDIYLKSRESYVFTAAFRSTERVALTITLKSRTGEIYDSGVVYADIGDYTEYSVILKSVNEDFDSVVSVTFSSSCTVMIGALSLMPENNFRGMRADVIARMKEIGICLLRWPGGNFAGEYNWKDGLLPRNMRSPLQSYQWIETQPHTYGYDFHEINTDDFVALCREIGAEPFITINPAWNTPEESAQWVEYCNGDVNTPYGRIRAERGNPEPYNVKFWSLGNEAGYGHMEGANTADAYAKALREHAEEMLKVSPGISLCSSGPYPNKEWVDFSAKPLSDIVNIVSLHRYTGFPVFFDTEKRKEEYNGFIKEADNENLDVIRVLRRQMDNAPVFISFDEWNAWYSWYRSGSVSEGVFAATFRNMLFRNADKYGVLIACHFESVNEGAIKVFPDRAELSPVGQVFSIMKDHAGGIICALMPDVTATRKESVVTVTLLNRSFSDSKKFTLHNVGNIISSDLYSSADVVPGTVFEKSHLDVSALEDSAAVVLPAHSIADIRFSVKNPE
ncbi:MAG: helix-turn-helix domain-containing protein [Clostridia bacterium]|nr:helix-turn-helix domain-containing protein [Clostridia bacterium]